MLGMLVSQIEPQLTKSFVMKNTVMEDEEDEEKGGGKPASEISAAQAVA